LIGHFGDGHFFILLTIVLVSLGVMAYFTFRLVRYHAAPAFFAAIWGGYLMIAAGSFFALYIFPVEQQHVFFLVLVLALYCLSVVPMIRLHLVSVEEKATTRDLRHTIEELTQAKQAADSAALAKHYFLTNMSHEIRTPMNAVLGFAEILGNRLLEYCPPDQLEDNRQTMSLIDKSSSDLLTIINDILDFSKVDAGQVEIEWVITEPKQIMKDVYDVLVPRLKEKPEISFRLEIDPSVPDWVYGDPTRLRQ